MVRLFLLVKTEEMNSIVAMVVIQFRTKTACSPLYQKE